MKSKGKGVGLVLVVCCFFLVCFLCVGFFFLCLFLKQFKRVPWGFRKTWWKPWCLGSFIRKLWRRRRLGRREGSAQSFKGAWWGDFGRWSEGYGELAAPLGHMLSCCFVPWVKWFTVPRSNPKCNQLCNTGLYFGVCSLLLLFLRGLKYRCL